MELKHKRSISLTKNIPLKVKSPGRNVDFVVLTEMTNTSFYLENQVKPFIYRLSRIKLNKVCCHTQTL